MLVPRTGLGSPAHSEVSAGGETEHVGDKQLPAALGRQRASKLLVPTHAYPVGFAGARAFGEEAQLPTQPLTAPCAVCAPEPTRLTERNPGSRKAQEDNRGRVAGNCQS